MPPARPYKRRLDVKMKFETKIADFTIRMATAEDVSTILMFIRSLAEYEKLLDEVVATEETLRETLFGEKPAAEVVLGELAGQPVCFALFFTNYSTWLAQPGLYLEDLFVLPEMRGRGYGKVLLTFLAQLAVERNYGRFEWSVLDWNELAISFYKSQGAELLDEWRICRVAGDALVDLAERF